mmetsp:Transcript_12732/g.30201  ORF Transcript_12732/g.30201 Transcript_12732/m.30201 type:complete len:233 (+) Transcript_12732:169-867(+)
MSSFKPVDLFGSCPNSLWPCQQAVYNASSGLNPTSAINFTTELPSSVPGLLDLLPNQTHLSTAFCEEDFSHASSTRSIQFGINEITGPVLSGPVCGPGYGFSVHSNSPENGLNPMVANFSETTNVDNGFSVENWQHQPEDLSSNVSQEDLNVDDVQNESWFQTLRSAGVRIKGRTKAELMQVAERIRKRRRESAARSRAKKADKMCTLRDENTRLRKENEELKKKLESLCSS